MQSGTFQDREDLDVYSAPLYRLRVQVQQVYCTVDGYQLKNNYIRTVRRVCLDADLTLGHTLLTVPREGLL